MMMASLIMAGRFDPSMHYVCMCAWFDFPIQNSELVEPDIDRRGRLRGANALERAVSREST